MVELVALVTLNCIHSQDVATPSFKMALIIAYILLTFSSCLPANSFSRRAATAVYTDYVNARPGKHDKYITMNRMLKVI